MSRLSKEFAIIPRTGLALTLLVVGVIVTCIFLFAEEAPGVRIAIATVVTLGIMTYGLLVSYIYADSKRRGMRPVLWTLVAAFVPNAIGFIVYFILRDSILQPCNTCGTAARREFAFCPSCGAGLPRVCQSCHKPVEPIWTHCAHCGSTLTAATAASTPASAPDNMPDEDEAQAQP